jgi:hypothetical protein
MSAGPAPQVAARRAALALHALGEEDRAWMLAQLQPQHRDLVEPLLGELRELGMQPDPRALEDVENETAVPVSASMRLASLARAEMQTLARVLEQEPPEVTRALLFAADPAWRRVLLGALDPAFALQVGRLAPAVPAAPALQRALAVAVERKFLERQAEARRRPAWWKRGSLRRRFA